jgi:hypothetical protein
LPSITEFWRAVDSAEAESEEPLPQSPTPFSECGALRRFKSAPLGALRR